MLSELVEEGRYAVDVALALPMELVVVGVCGVKCSHVFLDVSLSRSVGVEQVQLVTSMDML